MNPYEYIKEHGIKFSREEFLEIHGISIQLWEERFIGVKKWLQKNHEREILAHEIGHFETETVTVYSCQYYENLAERVWSELLIPTEAILEAIEDNEGICDISILAPVFWVTFDYMLKRIQYLWK